MVCEEDKSRSLDHYGPHDTSTDDHFPDRTITR
jgi:hypothetical protein